MLETILSLRYSITGVFDNGGHDSDASGIVSPVFILDSHGEFLLEVRAHVSAAVTSRVHILSHPHPEQSL